MDDLKKPCRGNSCTAWTTLVCGRCMRSLCKLHGAINLATMMHSDGSACVPAPASVGEGASRLDTPAATGDRLLAAIAADPDLAVFPVGTVMKLVRLVVSEVSPAVVAEAEAAFREATTKAMLAAADMLDVRAGTLLVVDTAEGVRMAATLIRESVEHGAAVRG